jgi:hypothetical protein
LLSSARPALPDAIRADPAGGAARASSSFVPPAQPSHPL